MSRNTYKFLVFFLLISAVMPKSETKCNCNCRLDEDKPICAENKATKVKETFQNECMMRCYACTFDKDYVIKFRRACESGSGSKNEQSPKSEL